MEKSFKLSIMLCALVIALLSLIPAAGVNPAKEWGTVTNQVVKDSQPDLNSSYLMNKKNGYSCYDIKTDSQDHRLECLKVPEEGTESYNIKMNYDLNGVLRFMESSCFYFFDPGDEKLKASFNDATEAFVESNAGIKNHKEIADIELLVNGAEKYKAFDVGEIIHIIAIDSSYADQYRRIVHYAVRPGFEKYMQ